MYSGYVIVCFWEEIMAAPAKLRGESPEEYRFRISSAEERARILHRRRVAAGEVPPPEGRGLGTHPGYERDFPPPLPPEPEDPSLQGTDPFLDAALWGSAVGPLAKAGVQALPRMIARGRPSRGYVRLYRGAGEPTGKKLPNWMTNPRNPELRGHSEALGRWWTNLKEAKKFYAKQHKKGVVYSVDVPKKVADQYLVKNLPLKPGGKATPHNPQAYSKRPWEEWYLPPEVTTKKTILKDFRPPPPPLHKLALPIAGTQR